MVINRQGFSLVELLITISIIAVLSALGLIAYTAVLQQGRDSKRQSDLRSIQSALEQYMSDQGNYPMTSTSCSNGAFGPFNNNCSLRDLSGNKIYMNTVPKDPVGTVEYYYVPLSSSGATCDNSTTPKCLAYCLYAKLDNSSMNIPSICGSSWPTSGSVSYNFVLTPP